jgi:hypothetical protein
VLGEFGVHASRYGKDAIGLMNADGRRAAGVMSIGRRRIAEGSQRRDYAEREPDCALLA